jgi:hypothetical protein
MIRKEKREIKAKLQLEDPVRSLAFPTRYGATNKPMLEQVEMTPNPSPKFPGFNISGGSE